MQDLEQIEYRKGMLEKGMKTADLPVKVWRAAKIPAEVRKAVNEENLLNLGGVYGDKRAGDPVEYDHLKLVLTDDMTRELLILFLVDLTKFLSGTSTKVKPKAQT